MGFLKSLFGKDTNVMQPPIQPPQQQNTGAPQTPVQEDGFIGGSLEIEDVFSIAGRGTVVTGRVKGMLRLNDNVIVDRQGDNQLQSVIIGIEAFRKNINEAHEGDNVGLLLRGVTRNQVNRGDVIHTA